MDLRGDEGVAPKNEDELGPPSSSSFGGRAIGPFPAESRRRLCVLARCGAGSLSGERRFVLFDPVERFADVGVIEGLVGQA